MIFGGSILAVALGTAAFVGAHFAMSHPLRATLLRLVGERGFAGVYSVIVALAFTWMIHAHATAPYVALWGDPVWARHLLLLIMIPSTFLVVAGNATPARSADQGAAGIHAISRHPGLMGMALWAIGHMIANGDAATVILTAGILVLTLGGSVAIDARKRARFGAEYERFLARTSIVPLVALAQGRAKFSWAALGLWRVALSVLVYVLLLLGHQLVIGRSALPV